MAPLSVFIWDIKGSNFKLPLPQLSNYIYSINQFQFHNFITICNIKLNWTTCKRQNQNIQKGIELIDSQNSLSLSLSLSRENEDINLIFLILKFKFHHRVEKYHQVTGLISPSAFVSIFLELLNLNEAENCLNFSIERFNINNIILLVQFKYNF